MNRRKIIDSALLAISIICVLSTLVIYVRSLTPNYGPYHLDVPFGYSQYVGQFANGSAYQINGATWQCVDQSTNASKIINFAIGNLTNVGGAIFISAGVYVLTAPILVTQKAIRLQGEDHGLCWSLNGTEFLCDFNNLPIIIVGNSYNGGNYVSADGVIINNIEFEPYDGSQTNVTGIWFRNSADVEVSQCAFSDLDSSFIRVTRVYEIRIFDNWFNQGWRVATAPMIYSSQAGEGAVDDFNTGIRIQNNFCGDASYQTINETASREGTICNNYIEGSWSMINPSSDQICLSGTSGNGAVYNNNIYGNMISGRFGGCGILLDSDNTFSNTVTYNTITGDESDLTGTAGIESRSVRNIISDNIIQNIAGFGIDIEEAFNTVVANTCCNCGTLGWGAGIIVGFSTGSVISDNICYNNNQSGICVVDDSFNSNLTITDNLCFNDGSGQQGTGIYFYAPNGMSDISDNICYDNALDGLLIGAYGSPSSGNTVIGNKLTSNGNYGIDVGDVGSLNNCFDDNDLRSNAWGPVGNSAPVGGNTYRDNEGFVTEAWGKNTTAANGGLQVAGLAGAPTYVTVSSGNTTTVICGALTFTSYGFIYSLESNSGTAEHGQTVYWYAVYQP